MLTNQRDGNHVAKIGLFLA